MSIFYSLFYYYLLVLEHRSFWSNLCLTLESWFLKLIIKNTCVSLSALSLLGVFLWEEFSRYPVGIGRKLSAHKTFRRRPRRLQSVQQFSKGAWVLPQKSCYGNSLRLHSCVGVLRDFQHTCWTYFWETLLLFLREGLLLYN